jgi:hypothetical protein
MVRFGDWSFVQVVSLGLSAFVTGYSSGTMSYIFDTNAHQRSVASNFYGFIPSSIKSRLLIRSCMSLLASSQLLSRSLGCALTAVSMGRRYVGFMIVGELALYLIYKVVRRDFYYFMNLTGFVRFLASFLLRVGGKVVADYTCK